MGEAKRRGTLEERAQQSIAAKQVAAQLEAERRAEARRKRLEWEASLTDEQRIQLKKRRTASIQTRAMLAGMMIGGVGHLER